MEPEICISRRIIDEIKIVLQKPKIDISLQKELEDYKTKDTIPFRLVKKIHDVNSQSGDFRSVSSCVQNRSV